MADSQNVQRDEFDRFKDEVRTDINDLKTSKAVTNLQFTQIIARLDKNDGHLTWLIRLIVGSIILAFMAYVYAGGLNIGK